MRKSWIIGIAVLVAGAGWIFLHSFEAPAPEETLIEPTREPSSSPAPISQAGPSPGVSKSTRPSPLGRATTTIQTEPHPRMISDEDHAPNATSELFARILSTPLAERPTIVRRELQLLPGEAFELRVDLLKTLVDDEGRIIDAAGTLALEELERRSLRELELGDAVKRSYYTRLMDLAITHQGAPAVLRLIGDERDARQKRLLKEAFRSAAQLEEKSSH